MILVILISIGRWSNILSHNTRKTIFDLIDRCRRLVDATFHTQNIGKIKFPNSSLSHHFYPEIPLDALDVLGRERDRPSPDRDRSPG